ncbi:acyltransferase [Paucibacter sp. PLA-PC-4]|uniref:acyltransferase n=1 Tax=Paucibacter sp. PLA-PC-4 TaxID=2993655 RepID=UPI00224A8CB0|nr:acyltransferase [Paucibacter sp. PLA-PC-4]MCX2865138.1 acyltransferase [Paucibacter sp. PLA-PC-4]
MTTSSNRFAAHLSAGPLRWLRQLRWQMRRPRDLKRLGAASRIMPPLRRVNAHCIEIGDRVVIGRNCLLQPLTAYLNQRFSPRLLIGDDCYVGPDCQFHCIDRIELGRGCVLSDQVYVSDVGHGMDPRAGLIMDQAVYSKGPVVMGDHCFVGFGAVVLSGVRLGDHCVVGARSVVTRSVPAHTMVAGNPARAIARFSTDSGRWERISGNLEAPLS